MDLTNADVQDILQLIDSMPVRELHLQTTRFTLSLRRADDGEWTQELQVLSEPNVLLAADHPAPDSTPAPSVSAARADVQIRDDDELVVVRAPLLGTFYRAPRPGAPPFVDVGTEVEPDTVVGIIETMKLMNSVSAGVHGTVAEILVANGEFAPQGGPLMRIASSRAAAPQ
jgi:acetyl-CoA carboxylase biotin carboxyl carrier protein